MKPKLKIDMNISINAVNIGKYGKVSYEIMTNLTLLQLPVLSRKHKTKMDSKI